jgi:hypothetical protein
MRVKQLDENVANDYNLQMLMAYLSDLESFSSFQEFFDLKKNHFFTLKFLDMKLDESHTALPGM